jgi:hypothetical protein
MTAQRLREKAEAVVAALAVYNADPTAANWNSYAVAKAKYEVAFSNPEFVLAQLDAARKDAERYRAAIEVARYAIETDAEETAIEADLGVSEWNACIRSGFKTAFIAIDAALNTDGEKE